MNLLEISKRDKEVASSLCLWDTMSNGRGHQRRKQNSGEYEGMECFHLLCLPCVSSASNSNLRRGEATLDMCMNDLLVVESRGFPLSSVGLEHALWPQ